MIWGEGGGSGCIRGSTEEDQGCRVIEVLFFFFFARTRQTVAMTHFHFVVWFNYVTKHLLSNEIENAMSRSHALRHG